MPSDGLMARRSHHNKLLRHNFGETIPTLLRDAGFQGSTEVAHRVSRLLGRVTYYCAAVPAGQSGAAAQGTP